MSNEKDHLSGKKKYNNGVIAKYFFPGEEPEGWVLGSIEEKKRKNSMATINQWLDPNFREKQLTTRATDEYHEKMSQISKEVWEKDHDAICESISKAKIAQYQNDEARQMRSEVQKRLWENPEYREKQINYLKECHKDLYDLHPEYRETMRRVITKAWENNKSEILAKQINTKKINGTYGKSLEEDAYYSYLLTIYDKDDIVRQYKDDRYPFWCDFYIKSEDKFIEYQGTWTHGGHPYNPDDIEDQKILESWKEKAKTSNYYAMAIDCWTVRDVLKRKTAQDNNLNIEFIY